MFDANFKTLQEGRLASVTEDTDLEALALSQNKRFWKLIDNAIARGKKEGFVDLADLEVDPRYCHQLFFPI
jgi:hypothetical protein